MTQKPLAIYIDDENINSEEYRHAMEKHFVVEYYTSIPRIDWLKDKILSLKPRILIQDIMLPRIDDGDGEIDDHLGLRILAVAREAIVQESVHVVVFSHRRQADLVPEVERLDFPDGLVTVLFKPDVGFKQLARHCLVKLEG